MGIRGLSGSSLNEVILHAVFISRMDRKIMKAVRAIVSWQWTLPVRHGSGADLLGTYKYQKRGCNLSLPGLILLFVKPLLLLGLLQIYIESNNFSQSIICTVDSQVNNLQKVNIYTKVTPILLSKQSWMYEQNFKSKLNTLWVP